MASIDGKEVFNRLNDVWWRLENLYFIQDEHGHVVRFTLRPAQRLFLMGLWYRSLILKARQLGFTTVIAIFALDRSLFNKNHASGIIAHTREDVIKIFESKVKFAFEHLPPDIKSTITAKADRANELQFSNGSQIRVAVSMRSGTLQLLHISEYGKLWAQYPKKAKEVQTGSLPTVHEKGIVIIESTAEGVGGDFHAKCLRAQQTDRSIKGGNRGPLSNKEYRFHFFPWYDNPRYKLTVPPGYEFSVQDDEYFKEVEDIGEATLSSEQRYWYVVTRAELTETLMKQEHPSHPEEAFLFSGRKAFDGTGLKLADKGCKPPIWRGNISPFDGTLTEAKDGNLLLWSRPVENLDYVIGADVAEGLVTGDYSSADVLDETGQQVAHLHGHLDPDIYGRSLDQLGRLFGNAYLGVERNNHGHAVLMRLKDLGYPRLHYEQIHDKAVMEETSGEKVGFLTNQVTKPLIIDNLAVLVRDEASGVRNTDTVTEMQSFIVDDRGRFTGQEGCHDDRVMSFAIAHEMLRVKPRKVRKFKLKRETGRDWRTK